MAIAFIKKPHHLYNLQDRNRATTWSWMLAMQDTYLSSYWGGRIRTSEWRYQKPLPYHLATPQLICASGITRALEVILHLRVAAI